MRCEYRLPVFFCAHVAGGRGARRFVCWDVRRFSSLLAPVEDSFRLFGAGFFGQRELVTLFSIPGLVDTI